MRPERLKIIGKRFTVRWVDKVTDENGKLLNGLADSDGLDIQINKNLALETEQDILLHEVLHAVEGQMGLDLQDTIIERLATGLLAVLKDNPRLVSYLRRKKPDGSTSL